MGLSSRGVVCDLVYGGGWMDTELSTTPTKPIKKPLRVSYPRVYVPMVEGIRTHGQGYDFGGCIYESRSQYPQITKQNRPDERGHVAAHKGRQVGHTSTVLVPEA